MERPITAIPRRGTAQASDSCGTTSQQRCDRIEFDRFSLLPSRRLLLRDGTPVRIGARAFDALLALVARTGELVTKEELTALLWPGTFVDPVNLRVNIAALRKALDDSDGRLIRTDTGRGYRFIAEVTQGALSQSPAPVASPPRQLPAAMTRLIGRSDFVANITDLIPHRRLVTIVGPGGIGKTRVAIACAEVLAEQYRDGVAFVDLSAVEESASIADTVAQTLDIASTTDDRLHDVMQHLATRQMLLVMDNCEHIVHAAAAIVEAISTSAPGVHVLATSREALRVRGEWVRSLPPLASPPEGLDLTAAAALSYAAVELFVERAAAAEEDFQLSDTNAPIVGEICRRLDGVALAIELAASEVHVFGLTWLAAHLNERLCVLGHGNRTAVARHQTLTAMLDWSYRLLSEQERETLRRVSVFSGEFTLSEAIAISAGNGIADIQVVSAVGGLVAKSLAMSDVTEVVTRYRLHETTRVYACAKMCRTEPPTALAAA